MGLECVPTATVTVSLSVVLICSPCVDTSKDTEQRQNPYPTVPVPMGVPLDQVPWVPRAPQAVASSIVPPYVRVSPPHTSTDCSRCGHH